MRVKHFTEELEVTEVRLRSAKHAKFKYIHVPAFTSPTQSLRALLTCVSPPSAPSLPPSLFHSSFQLCPFQEWRSKTSNASRDKPVTYTWVEKVGCRAIERRTQTASKHSGSKHLSALCPTKYVLLPSALQCPSLSQPAKTEGHQNWTWRGLSPPPPRVS